MPAARSGEDWRRWAPWIVFGLVLFGLCLGWLLLPLREWMDGLQHWLLGLRARGVVIFAAILIVMTFFVAPQAPVFTPGLGAFMVLPSKREQDLRRDSSDVKPVERHETCGDCRSVRNRKAPNGGKCENQAAIPTGSRSEAGSNPGPHWEPSPFMAGSMSVPEVCIASR